MSLSPAQLDALAKIADASVIAARVTGCPPELSVAQCIIESDWLTRAPGNNCFGIKSTDSNEQYSLTKEFINGAWRSERDGFETYDTLLDCFIAHGRLIAEGKPYTVAWQQYERDGDLDLLIAGIARRYATDPGYTQEILTLAHGPHVTAAIEKARQA